MIRCPRCGSIDVIGGRYVHLVADHSAVLPCECGACEDGIAVVTDDRRVRLVRKCGPLDPTGNWAVEVVTEATGTDNEPARTQVYCPLCVAGADPTNWAGRSCDITVDWAGQTPFFACHGCAGEYPLD